MRDGELTLSYSGTSITFGLPDSPVGAFLTERPDLGDVDIETTDARRPRGDGVLFGKDFFSGRTITLPLAIAENTEGDALDLLGLVRSAWRADKVRLTPGATATLTFRRAGRERVVFGRPRRFAEDINYTAQGVITFLADFAAADDLYYSPTESSVVIPFAPAPTGGLLAPLASPLATTGDSDRSMGIVVGGKLPVWPVIEIHGPIVNPIVEIVGVSKMEFRLTLGASDVLRVDSTPWARTVLLNNAGAAGSLTRASTRLADAAIPPGTYEVVLRGSSSTGTAFASLRWRDTYPSL